MTYLKIASACLICLSILSGCRHSNDLSKSVKDFKETNPGKGGMSLFLYPSTIRMLNFDKDTSFNSLVKDIQKLKIIKTDSVNPEQVQKLIEEFEFDHELRSKNLLGLDGKFRKQNDYSSNRFISF